MKARSLADVDASAAFASPLRVVVVLTFVAGLLDAVDYDRYGVFTANQAGNLVIAWTLLPEAPAAALLSFASILGCGLGVVIAVVVRRVWPWLAGPTGARLMLVCAALAIVAAAGFGSVIAGDLPTAVEPWSRDWWGQAVSVMVSAAAVASLAMVFVSGGGMRAPILASTNAYVDAVRYATAAVGSEASSDLRALARKAAAFPLAWTLGAALSVLVPIPPLALVVLASLLVVGVALLARRVNESAGEVRRTV